jgi:fucose 4-O-acetylase-like acetyltransferase
MTSSAPLVRELPSGKAVPKPQSSQWILIAKGIGIILVVIGHFDPDTAPAYWHGVHDVIYSFHMPLFFAMSGVLYSHGKYAYPQLIANKVRRLLYPFVSIALIFLAVKLAAAHLAHLNHPVDARSVYMLLVDPVRSYMPLLWFVHALFFIFVIYPLLRQVLKWNAVILVLLVVANFLMHRRWPVIGAALLYMPYFIVGVMVRDHQRSVLGAFDRHLSMLLIPLVTFVASYLGAVNVQVEWQQSVLALITAVSGAMFCMAVSRAIEQRAPGGTSRTLATVGFYSMSIYLLHPLFESPVRIAFGQWAPLAPVPFEVVAFLAIVCGVVVPLLLEKYVLRRIALTRIYVLGLGEGRPSTR